MADSIRVGIIMGSDSDLDQVRGAAELLDEFGVGCEMRILSAHRTPDLVADYARQAGQRGLQVLIAAAGMSAALAGVLSAHCDLPVIGIPVASGPLNGVDALLSTAQMPPGVPVAAVAIGSAGARNAAVLAVRILALGDRALAQKLQEYRRSLAQSVCKKDQALREGGAIRGKSK